ncbi:hypothetical protein CNY67_01900 [Desulfovibrio sp. G11]|nr:hypothetical protein CNY67_01900 [Desulfovibrio sp. G11]
MYCANIVALLRQKNIRWVRHCAGLRRNAATGGSCAGAGCAPGMPDVQASGAKAARVHAPGVFSPVMENYFPRIQ